MNSFHSILFWNHADLNTRWPHLACYHSYQDLGWNHPLRLCSSCHPQEPFPHPRYTYKIAGWIMSHPTFHKFPLSLSGRIAVIEPDFFFFSCFTIPCSPFSWTLVYPLHMFLSEMVTVGTLLCLIWHWAVRGWLSHVNKTILYPHTWYLSLCVPHKNHAFKMTLEIWQHVYVKKKKKVSNDRWISSKNKTVLSSPWASPGCILF